MLNLTVEGLKAGASFLAGRTSLFLISHGPQIMTGAGVLGLVGTVVMASKASYNLHGVLEDHKDTKAYINQSKQDLGEEYTDQQYAEDLRRLRIHQWISIGKLYIPPLVLGTLSVATIIGGQTILNNRLVGLGAAYKGLDAAFKRYRASVEDYHKSEGRDPKFFDEMHKAGAVETTVRTVETDLETGKSEKKEKRLLRIDTDNLHGYMVEFSEETSTFARSTWESNDYFLDLQEKAANHFLQRKGHLFLNEVKTLLGLPPTPEGQIVGWFYDPSDESRDNVVSFDLKAEYNRQDPANLAASNIWILDFNVDGPIINLI